MHACSYQTNCTYFVSLVAIALVFSFMIRMHKIQTCGYNYHLDDKHNLLHARLALFNPLRPKTQYIGLIIPILKLFITFYNDIVVQLVTLLHV